jgi:hypothetical protein
MAKKKARQNAKAGYYTNLTSTTMECQIEKAILYDAVLNAEGQKRYIVETSNVLSKSPEAGKQHAIETAKIKIAGYLQSTILGLVETSLSNNQLSMKEAEQINKMVSNYENWIAQNLGSVEPIGAIYKKHHDKIEVEVCIAYNMENAANITRNAVINKLSEDTKISKDKLNDVLKRNNFKSFEQEKSN